VLDVAERAAPLAAYAEIEFLNILVFAQAGGIVVKYEDVAASPEKELRSLFSRLGLDWPDSTTQFLQTSSAGEGSYYSLTRDPLVAISRWKQEMPQAHIEKVQDIVSRAPVGRQYFS